MMKPIGERQKWLNSLVVNDEVALDFRTQGRGCKVYRIQEIVSTKKYSRAFRVNGSIFSPAGEHIPDDGHESWPSSCCLENPDILDIHCGSQTRRQGSERWHAIVTLTSLVKCLEHVPTDKIVAMIRGFNPKYEPRW